MPDHSLPISPHPAWASFEAVEEAAHAARACRIATGEVMTYVVEDWVVREHAGGRIERLAPLADFRDEDFPYPHDPAARVRRAERVREEQPA